MTNRQITYTITLDDQFTGPLKRAVADLRREFVGLKADTSKLGGSSGGFHSGPGPSVTGAVGSTAVAGPLSGNRIEMILGRMEGHLARIAGGGGGGGGGQGGWGGQAGGSGIRGGWNSMGGRGVPTWTPPQTSRWSGWAPDRENSRAWMGLKMGAGAIGHGILTIGNQWQQDADRQMALGIGAQDANMIDKAGNASISGKRLSVGGNILRGAAIGSVGGPIGTVAGAAVAAMSDLDGLAESIMGISMAAEDAKLKLNEIGAFDGRRRDSLTMAKVHGIRSERQDIMAQGRAMGVTRLESGLEGDGSESLRQERMARLRDRAQFLENNEKGLGGRGNNLAVETGRAANAKEAISSTMSVLQMERESFEYRKNELDITRQMAETRKASLEGELNSVRQVLSMRKQEFAGHAQRFGQMNKFDQQRTIGIAEKLEAGQAISKQDERFARENPLFNRPLAKLDEQRAREGGFYDNAATRKLAGANEIKNLEGRDRELSANIKAEANVLIQVQLDDKQLEQQFAKVAKALNMKIEVLSAKWENLAEGLEGIRSGQAAGKAAVRGMSN